MLKCWICFFLSALCVYFKIEHVSGKGDCKYGTYGLNCDYTCHCDVNNCDDVTGCNDGPNSCKIGWSGPKCTIENVALEKTTKQSSYYKEYRNSSLAVDGDSIQQGYYATNCILTNPGQPYTWWQVDLGTEYFIQNITVYFRDDRVRMNGVKIYACQSENWTDACLCYTVKSVYSVIKHITCDKTARYVTLYQSTNRTGDTAMEFCEVEVSACDSHFYGSLCTQDCSERHCNGKSTCNTVGKCDNGCTPGYESTDCKQECSSDRYGRNCLKLCTERKCFGDLTCDPVKGTCVDGCQRGYESTDCTTICNNKYGYNCNMSCAQRQCKGRQECDTFHGICKDGCLPGWKPPDCAIKCSRDRHGQNCAKLCTDRKCFGNSICDAVNGTCVDGCQRGYESTDCTTSCKGTYGYNCNMSCADRHCKGRQDCDTEKGTCKDGCLSPWVQPDCTVTVTSSDVNKDVIIIVISTVLVLVVVIFITVTVCFIRRLKRKTENATRESKVNRVRTHQNSELEDEHYENIEQRNEETQSEPGGYTNFPSSDVFTVSGYVNSQISRDQLEKNTTRNDYVNSSQNIEMNEYEKLKLNELSRNTYEKITGI